eukprot:Ihof_evm2s111 gene=Ihof_evmTU2s111
MVQSAGTGPSNTHVGKGSGAAPSNLRSRNSGHTHSTKPSSQASTPSVDPPSNMLRFYSEGAPGLQ